MFTVINQKTEKIEYCSESHEEAELYVQEKILTAVDQAAARLYCSCNYESLEDLKNFRQIVRFACAAYGAYDCKIFQIDMDSDRKEFLIACDDDQFQFYISRAEILNTFSRIQKEKERRKINRRLKKIY